MNTKLITSEAVSYGHPDKIADQVADAILDEYLRFDKNSRCGIEVLVKDNIVVLGGEVYSDTSIDHEKVVKNVFSTLHFTSEHHLSPNEIKIINLIGQQSPEIHSGVDRENEVCAGDQGFMVGYASNDTSVYMPLGHYLARAICELVSNHKHLGPDAKSQVIVEHDEDGKPIAVKSILVSVMHTCDINEVRSLVKKLITEDNNYIDKDIFNTYINHKNIKIDVNPCGTWNIGGPVSDCGVTGRKLVVDAYGGYCNIGGGNYSGKEMSKVDRSGAYMCRYLAKNIVATGLFDNAKVTLSYSIGVSKPTSFEIEVNRNKDLVPMLKEWLMNNIDMTPGFFIKKFLNENSCFYLTSKFGHYGFDGDDIRPWEKLDLCDEIRNNLIN